MLPKTPRLPFFPARHLAVAAACMLAALTLTRTARARSGCPSSMVTSHGHCCPAGSEWRANSLRCETRNAHQLCALGDLQVCADEADAQLQEGDTGKAEYAAELLGFACDGQHVPSCTSLGELHARGLGVEMDQARAVELFEGSCAAGDLAGCTLLAQHRLQRGHKEQASEPARLLLQTCHRGDAAACAEYAYWLSEQDAAPQEPLTSGARARLQPDHFHQRACQLGDARGCLELAQGARDAGDRASARVWLERGCALDEGSSCTHLGHLLNDDPSASTMRPTVIELYAKGCTAGDLRGCTSLAAVLEQSSDENSTGDIDRALELYRDACEGGEPYACGHLGALRMEGRLLTRDPTEAAHLFGRACTGGEPMACLQLGLMYLDGNGVHTDPGRGVALLEQTCIAGAIDGCVALGQTYALGQGVPRDLARASALFQRACKDGSSAGCTALDHIDGGGTDAISDEHGR